MSVLGSTTKSCLTIYCTLHNTVRIQSGQRNKYAKFAASCFALRQGNYGFNARKKTGIKLKKLDIFFTKKKTKNMAIFFRALQLAFTSLSASRQTDKTLSSSPKIKNGKN